MNSPNEAVRFRELWSHFMAERETASPVVRFRAATNLYCCTWSLWKGVVLEKLTGITVWFATARTADLEIGGTAGLETCATKGGSRVRHGYARPTEVCGHDLPL